MEGNLTGRIIVVLFKPHYLIINKYENDRSLDGFLYSIPANNDIKDLYVISDVLITDYSSVFFDYAILKRPMYFYMYDLESYASDLRGFIWISQKSFQAKSIVMKNNFVKILKTAFMMRPI